MPNPPVYAAAGNSSRAYLHRFLTRAGQEVQPGQLVLDAGSGRAPYRDLFAHARYETADFLAVKGKNYTEHDYVCDLADIPVEDARFDHVLLTQVLEHLPEPRAVLAELCRVLKPGGTLWLTAPLFYAEHEKPYDFFRYTQFGLRHLLEGAGFEVREIDWMEGYLGTLSYQTRLMSKACPPPAATTAAARRAWRCRWRQRPRAARGRASPTPWRDSTCASSSPAGGCRRTTRSWPRSSPC